MALSRTFELFVAEYFEQKGFIVNITSFSGDYGVDIFAEKANRKIAIQAKMYGGSARKINRKSFMELYGAKTYFGCDHAVMVTNGGVLNDALEVAQKLNIEIVNLEFRYEDQSLEKNNTSFDSMWLNYIIPLKGKELLNDRGLKNIILDVDWSGIKRITSTGKVNKINIEIFKEAYNKLLHEGSVSRNYINQNYTGRGSSGVVMILSQLPFIGLIQRPLGLIWESDETSYLLKSPANATRLLNGI